jgi:hypothetical protein
MLKQRMSHSRSMIGTSLVAAALAAFGFASNAFGAGGQNGGGGGGGFGGGHTGGGFGGGGGHSPGVSPAFSPSGGGHFSPGFTGGGSSSSRPQRPFIGPQHNPGWQQNWMNGQFLGSNWAGFGNGTFVRFPFVFVPVYFGGGYGYGYPYYYDYGNPYAYYSLYPYDDDGLPSVNVAPAANPGPPIAAGNAPAANAAAPNAGGAAAVADAGAADGSAGAEYFAQAEAAFQQGRYNDALRYANHAAVESPKNPKAHELMSLSLFALAEYRDAAIEAHAAIALGPIADWATVFGYYGDQAKYTTQLRALEKYSHEKPNSAEARFLRAYHYLMTGHIDAAKEQLAEAVKLTPADKLAAELLKKYSDNAVAPQPAGAAPKDAPQDHPAAKPANPDPDGFDT